MFAAASFQRANKTATRQTTPAVTAGRGCPLLI